MGFDLPRGRLFPVSGVDVSLADEPLPFEREHEAAIARHWEKEIAANPALWDGRIAMLSSLAYRDGRLVGRCHVARYSTFLYWRSQIGEKAAEHYFAYAVLVSSDGALIAARMGDHTLNAGRIYFAAGSFEPEDFRDGQVDLHGNMVREVREETGIDLSEAKAAPDYLAFSAPSGTALFRRYDLAEDADTLAARISTFIASEAEPELAEPVIIRSAANLPEELTPHMRAIVDWHFGLA